MYAHVLTPGNCVRRLPVGLAVCFALGCSSKGELAGILTVQATPELTAQGVSVQDWKYSNKTFAVKLEATKDFGAPWLITVQADSGPVFTMMSPITLKAGESQWVEFGGFKFLDRFEVTPQTKSVTVGVRNRLQAR